MYLIGSIKILGAPLLYLGPDSIMPIASTLAALVGLLLIFWRFIIRFFRKLFRKITGKKDEIETMEQVLPVSESISDESGRHEE